MNFESLLYEGCRQLGLDLTSQQIEKLLVLHEQLMKWNKAFNLTAINDPEEALKLHILDSLSVAAIWRDNAESLGKTLDVGTGAGFPGLPLAIVLPKLTFHLLDSNSKKTRFITQQVHLLKLDNVEVFHSRIQKHPISDYDCITSRAFASLSDFTELTRNLLASSGKWYAMKGIYADSGLDDLAQDIEEKQVYQLSVPGVDAERCLIHLGFKS